ncbi:hypothetical protein Hanom_Chr08g00719701 [Helianthus anomalus]
MRGPDSPIGEGAAEGGWRVIGEVGRGVVTEEGRGRVWGHHLSKPINYFFFFNKKTSHLIGECRHQIRVRVKFKRGVDVT